MISEEQSQGKWFPLPQGGDDHEPTSSVLWEGKPSGLREPRNRTYQRSASKMSSRGMMFELSSRSEEVCSRQREWHVWSHRSTQPQPGQFRKKQSDPWGQSKGHGGDRKERDLGALRNQNFIVNIIGSYLMEFNQEKDIIRFLTQYVQNLTPQISSPNSLPMVSQPQNSDSFSTVRTPR